MNMISNSLVATVVEFEKTEFCEDQIDDVVDTVGVVPEESVGRESTLPPTLGGIFPDHPADQRPWAQMHMPVTVFVERGHGPPEHPRIQYNVGFEKQKIRGRFIQKIFIIIIIELSLMLYATKWAADNMDVFKLFSRFQFFLWGWFSILLFSVGLIFSRKFPFNYLVVLGTIMSHMLLSAGHALLISHNTLNVVYGMFILILIYMTLISALTKIDITDPPSMVATICVAACIGGITPLIRACFYQVNWWTVVVAYFCLIVFLVYVTFFIQICLRAKWLLLTPDDYVIAAGMFSVFFIAIFLKYLYDLINDLYD